MPTPRSSARGFTLLEAMVAVAIAAITSTIALPSIESQVQRMRRTDALVTVLAVQLAQERWRGNAPAYGTLAQVGVAATTTQGHYGLALADAGATGYTLTATAIGAQARDAACRVLRLTVAGGDTLLASGPDATVGNDAAANRRCWNR
jgi:type IV pilus assembly protein PilE